jgi:uncharacterized YccA/Bax inhibitor family protein
MLLATAAHIAAPPRRLAYATLTLALLAFLVLEVSWHAHWGAAALGALGPDLALVLGAASGLAKGQLHPRAVPVYNVLHRFWLPAALLVAAAFGVAGHAVFVLALAWAFHVSLDRSVGYGLRDRHGFQRAG